MTLLPGDILSTGTPSGVGYARTPPEFLKPGDVVACEVDRIGRISNRVVQVEGEVLRLDFDWQYRGLQVVRLENDLLCIDVLPELGAKIYNFVHKPSGRNLLWHNPTLPPARQHYGAAYDDNWSGGWDELLPNDLPRAAPGGDLLPDHGEFWSQAADWEVTAASERRIEVRFSSHGRVLATRFEKTICLEAGGAARPPELRLP